MPQLVRSAFFSSQDGAELIERLKRREPQAMADVYDRLGKASFSIILRIVKDENVAEDLLQETFIKVWNRVDGFSRGRGSLGPWVLSIARNRAIDYLRSTGPKSLQNKCNLDYLEEPRFFTDLEANYHKLDRVQAVTKVFTKLNINQREILELAYLEGLSLGDIAARIQQLPGTVRTWVQIALQLLRDEPDRVIGTEGKTE